MSNYYYNCYKFIKPCFVCLIDEFFLQVSLLQNESVEKNKSIQSLHNQICSFEIEIERQKEMLRNNESKILHLQVRSLHLWLDPQGRGACLFFRTLSVRRLSKGPDFCQIDHLCLLLKPRERHRPLFLPPPPFSLDNKPQASLLCL